MTLWGSPLIRVMKAPPRPSMVKAPATLADAGLLADLTVLDDGDVVSADEDALVTSHPAPPLPGTVSGVGLAEDTSVEIEYGVAGHHDRPVGGVLVKGPGADDRVGLEAAQPGRHGGSVLPRKAALVSSRGDDDRFDAG